MVYCDILPWYTAMVYKLCSHVIFLRENGNFSLEGALLGKGTDNVLQLDVGGWNRLLKERVHVCH